MNSLSVSFIKYCIHTIQSLEIQVSFKMGFFVCFLFCCLQLESIELAGEKQTQRNDFVAEQE